MNPPSGGGGTSGGGKGTTCRGIVPRSSISTKHLTAKQKLLAFSGHSIEFDCAKGKQAAGRVKRVLVSVGLVAHGKCRFLGANGRLGKARKCSKAVFLAAKVKNGPGKLTSWTFKKKVSLPLGRYVVAVRGVDPKGHRELIPRTTNNASFILYAHGKTKVPHRRPH